MDAFMGGLRLGRLERRRLHLLRRAVEVPFLARLPEAQKDRRHYEREDAAAHVGHGEQGNAKRHHGGENELKDGEGTASHKEDRPYLKRLPPGTHAADHVKRYEKG